MRKPCVIKVSRSTRKTAFLLSDVCPCTKNLSAVRLTLTKCGCQNDCVVLTPLSVDDKGYVVFDWCDCINYLEDGYYFGVFSYECTDCKKVLFQIGAKEPCEIQDVIHTVKKGDYNEPCDCHTVKPFELYVPKYDIKTEY